MNFFFFFHFVKITNDKKKKLITECGLQYYSNECQVSRPAVTWRATTTSEAVMWYIWLWPLRGDSAKTLRKQSSWVLNISADSHGKESCCSVWTEIGIRSQLLNYLHRYFCNLSSRVDRSSFEETFEANPFLSLHFKCKS